VDCVEDVVQETLIRILDRLHTFRGDSRFMSWATAIGVRTGLELNRKQYWKTHTLGEFVKDSDYNLAGPWQSDEPAPQAEIERREILTALSAAIQMVLTDRQRLALLAELKGMPVTAIAGELGTTRGSVYKTTHDARKKLKAELERQGFDASFVIASIGKG
jgi:RNA polymerase sigma-70 factor (ECF subfamily)